ncbi:MAG TPA: exonuclease domain-containing protein [Symbiobacteriaceae bacterium]
MYVDPKDLPSDHTVGCIVDIETTGLSPSTCEVIEIGLVLFACDRRTGQVYGILDEYLGQQEPVRQIPPEATAIHGLTKAALRGKKFDWERIESILNRADFLLAHNAKFDHKFMAGLTKTVSKKPWYCSMNGVDWYALGHASKGLQNLLRDHAISTARAHRGLDDARAVLALVSLPGPKGHPYLFDILQKGPAVRPGSVPGYLKNRPAPKPKPQPVSRSRQPQPEASRPGCLAWLFQVAFEAIARTIQERTDRPKKQKQPAPPQEAIVPQRRVQNPEWYYQLDGMVCGPITEWELERMLSAGELAPDTPIRHEKDRTWRPANKY